MRLPRGIEQRDFRESTGVFKKMMINRARIRGCSAKTLIIRYILAMKLFLAGAIFTQVPPQTGKQINVSVDTRERLVLAVACRTVRDIHNESGVRRTHWIPYILR